MNILLNPIYAWKKQFFSRYKGQRRSRKNLFFISQS